MTLRLLLLSSAALGWTPALAQQADPAADEPTAEGTQPTAVATDFDEDGETIVVTGQKPRGSVIGDIPAENILGPRDIRATGATTIAELLDSVAAQTGSARGRSSGPPVVLLNGQRISGFRELRDLPPEAIQRMEILPEEVALKYGYSADQRVVNIVLRDRFDATTAELRGRVASEGGHAFGSTDLSKLIIRDGRRNSVALHVEGNGALDEIERDLVLQPVGIEAVDPRDERTLIGSNRTARLTGSFNRPLGDASATLTAEAEKSHGRSLFGVATGTLETLGGDTLVRAFDGDALARTSDSEAARLGLSVNGQADKWRWSTISNAELVNSESRSDRGPDLAAVQDAVDGGTLDPFGPLGPLDALQQDRSRSKRHSLSLDGTLNGPLATLPAGTANVTVKLGASTLGIDSQSRRRGVGTSSDLDRTVGEGAVNIDLPLAKRDSPVGRLTANLNGGLSAYSDAGTLTSVGAGLNWSPARRLNLLTSWTREEGAPSLQQLGDPLVESDNVPFFDAVEGETVPVTTLTGGNPALDPDRRTVWKVGGNWQPIEETDLRLRAEFVHQTIDDPQIGFPAATPALEAAFPDRFERDGEGRLLRVDLRPVNAKRSRRDTLRWGFDFTKPLASKPPSPADIQRLRERFARAGGSASQVPAPASGSSPLAGEAAPSSDEGERRFRGGGGGGGGGGGRFGGGRSGGRLTFSATHSLTFKDSLTIADDLDPLDYLDGEAAGNTGGRARHQVEVETGYYNNGLGLRLSGDWRSATRVATGDGEDLRFSDYATVDLRLFANLGERFDIVSRSPFFLGSSVRFEIRNLFDSGPKVRDGMGNVPLAYQADRLEPLGRTVGISFRKMFLPTRFFRFGSPGGGSGRSRD